MPAETARHPQIPGARIIDGRAVAAGLRARLAEAIAAAPFAPRLDVILVGADPASAVYVKAKEKAAREAGMVSQIHRLPAETGQAELLALIARLNADATVDGILVQLPLPAQIDQVAVIEAIDPAKDVDGFTLTNVGRLAAGLPGLVPCTPRGCMVLLRETLGDLRGKRAVVVGRSAIVGRPMAQLLVQADCTVAIAHSRSADPAGECRTADIVVAAAGRAGLVTADWIGPGAAVIDVGINRLADGRLVGDVAFEKVAAIAGAITPVPGGVGPMTIACLLENTLEAARRRRGLPLAAAAE
ncbi:bifunctional methylenetetrahydrofolate dehydrogenase/methenyltetrahydrofolate cyclohydrolase FolD [Salinarimonas sp.]|uniref:bifunctional 5,10-methylenetetrahydrofolate dehydrogenase/5,10-methenyltetrahydrofolate cyclohydrolase n=1 Tax=Salinarimonas sp. TaxID=2766526 RepID=UPI0032D964CE